MWLKNQRTTKFSLRVSLKFSHVFSPCLLLISTVKSICGVTRTEFQQIPGLTWTWRSCQRWALFRFDFEGLMSNLDYPGYLIGNCTISLAIYIHLWSFVLEWYHYIVPTNYQGTISVAILLCFLFKGEPQLVNQALSDRMSPVDQPNGHGRGRQPDDQQKNLELKGVKRGLDPWRGGDV